MSGFMSVRSPAQRKRNRRRALSLIGFSQNWGTHLIHGLAGIGVTPLVTGDIFPDRSIEIMFQTRIRILANAGVHRGLIFEFGSSSRGCAAWVGDNTIGFTAGSGTVANDRAEALFDFGGELPVSREFQLIFAVKTGSGRIRIFDGGLRIADQTAVNGDFNGDYSDAADGSFASALVGTITPGVPAASQIAPSGFEVIEPLTIFNGQHPREFF